VVAPSGPTPRQRFLVDPVIPVFRDQAEVLSGPELEPSAEVLEGVVGEGEADAGRDERNNELGRQVESDIGGQGKVVDYVVEAESYRQDARDIGIEPKGLDDGDVPV
jgi:hypothetical protein